MTKLTGVCLPTGCCLKASLSPWHSWVQQGPGLVTVDRALLTVWSSSYLATPLYPVHLSALLTCHLSRGLLGMPLPSLWPRNCQAQIGYTSSQQHQIKKPHGHLLNVLLPAGLQVPKDRPLSPSSPTVSLCWSWFLAQVRGSVHVCRRSTCLKTCMIRDTEGCLWMRRGRRRWLSQQSSQKRPED